MPQSICWLLLRSAHCLWLLESKTFILTTMKTSEGQWLTRIYKICTKRFQRDFLHYPTILLLTSSSMALTNSAALGVSELDGRTDRREEVWVKIERWGFKNGKIALEPAKTYKLQPTSANSKSAVWLRESLHISSYRENGGFYNNQTIV